MLLRTVRYSPLQNCADANYPIILYYLAYEGQSCKSIAKHQVTKEPPSASLNGLQNNAIKILTDSLKEHLLCARHDVNHFILLFIHSSTRKKYLLCDGIYINYRMYLPKFCKVDIIIPVLQTV